jgi:hypothetical protein
MGHNCEECEREIGATFYANNGNDKALSTGRFCPFCGDRIGARACGKKHGEPCGLDEDCPVPSDYFDSEKTDRQALEAYEEENLY